ncbi:hypothetical protein SDC9_168251 [bioreactor metagenome]|uniref:Uncharacterized protein n=1 Tax=bioreactor metagenome TaxID=1076179 RepID=A0A645G4J1_9ZZZZ
MQAGIGAGQCTSSYAAGHDDVVPPIHDRLELLGAGSDDMVQVDGQFWFIECPHIRFHLLVQFIVRNHHKNLDHRRHLPCAEYSMRRLDCPERIASTGAFR